jgi:hypothetical protein
MSGREAYWIIIVNVKDLQDAKGANSYRSLVFSVFLVAHVLRWLRGEWK